MGARKSTAPTTIDPVIFARLSRGFTVMRKISAWMIRICYFSLISGSLINDHPWKIGLILCVAQTRLHNRSITASDGQNGAKGISHHTLQNELVESMLQRCEPCYQYDCFD